MIDGIGGMSAFGSIQILASRAARRLHRIILRLATRRPKPLGDARFGALHQTSEVGGQPRPMILGMTRHGKGIGFDRPTYH